MNCVDAFNGFQYLAAIGFVRVVLFHNTRFNDSRSNNALFMHKLYLFLDAINRMMWGTQTTLPWKVKRFNWIIQIRFNSFLLKKKMR